MVEAVPEPLARQAAEPRAAQVERVNLLRCKQAAHKRMVAVAVEPGRLWVPVALAAAVQHRLRAWLVPRTRAAVAALDLFRSAAVLAVQAAQGSLWCERSSVVLLRVS